MACTEQFYRRLVEEEMGVAGARLTDEDRRVVVDALKAAQSEPDFLTEEDEDEAERRRERLRSALAELDSGAPLGSGEDDEADAAARLFASLSVHEQERFRVALESGELARKVQTWVPFWERGRAKIAVVRADNADGADEDALDAGDALLAGLAPPPAVPDDIPALASLLPSGREPSPLLSFHLLDLLLAYALAMRTFNGDWHQDPPAFLQLLLDTSLVAAAAQKRPAEARALLIPLDALEPTVDAAMARIVASKINPNATSEAARAALDDVVALTADAQLVLTALTDMELASKRVDAVPALAKKLRFFLALIADRGTVLLRRVHAPLLVLAEARKAAAAVA